MHITWLGSTTLKIQAKPHDQDITIVIDPYRLETGNSPRSLSPQIALFSRGLTNAITLSGNPFILAHPGECEIKGVLVMGIQGRNAPETMFRLDVEGVSLAHLGMVNTTLTNTQIDALQGTDILCLPVGGEPGLNAETAAKMANILEPRIIIPLAHYSSADPKATPVQIFLKEMGLTADKPEAKVILKKKDLPEEETKVIVLRLE